MTPDDAMDAIRRVEALHSQSLGSYRDSNGQEWSGYYCTHCKDEWPCATAEALIAAPGPDFA